MIPVGPTLSDWITTSQKKITNCRPGKVDNLDHVLSLFLDGLMSIIRSVNKLQVTYNFSDGICDVCSFFSFEVVPFLFEFYSVTYYLFD